MALEVIKTPSSAKIETYDFETGELSANGKGLDYKGSTYSYKVEGGKVTWIDESKVEDLENPSPSELRRMAFPNEEGRKAIFEHLKGNAPLPGDGAYHLEKGRISVVSEAVEAKKAEKILNNVREKAKKAALKASEDLKVKEEEKKRETIETESSRLLKEVEAQYGDFKALIKEMSLAHKAKDIKIVDEKITEIGYLLIQVGQKMMDAFAVTKKDSSVKLTKDEAQLNKIRDKIQKKMPRIQALIPKITNRLKKEKEAEAQLEAVEIDSTEILDKFAPLETLMRAGKIQESHDELQILETEVNILITDINVLFQTCHDANSLKSDSIEKRAKVVVEILKKEKEILSDEFNYINKLTPFDEEVAKEFKALGYSKAIGKKIDMPGAGEDFKINMDSKPHPLDPTLFLEIKNGKAQWLQNGAAANAPHNEFEVIAQIIAQAYPHLASSSLLSPGNKDLEFTLITAPIKSQIHQHSIATIVQDRIAAGISRPSSPRVIKEGTHKTADLILNDLKTGASTGWSLGAAGFKKGADAVKSTVGFMKQTPGNLSQTAAAGSLALDQEQAKISSQNTKSSILERAVRMARASAATIPHVLGNWKEAGAEKMYKNEARKELAEYIKARRLVLKTEPAYLASRFTDAEVDALIRFELEKLPKSGGLMRGLIKVNDKHLLNNKFALKKESDDLAALLITMPYITTPERNGLQLKILNRKESHPGLSNPAKNLNLIDEAFALASGITLVKNDVNGKEFYHEVLIRRAVARLPLEAQVYTLLADSQLQQITDTDQQDLIIALQLQKTLNQPEAQRVLGNITPKEALVETLGAAMPNNDLEGLLTSFQRIKQIREGIENDATITDKATELTRVLNEPAFLVSQPKIQSLNLSTPELIQMEAYLNAASTQAMMNTFPVEGGRADSVSQKTRGAANLGGRGLKKGASAAWNGIESAFNKTVAGGTDTYKKVDAWMGRREDVLKEDIIDLIEALREPNAKGLRPSKEEIKDELRLIYLSKFSVPHGPTDHRGLDAFIDEAMKMAWRGRVNTGMRNGAEKAWHVLAGKPGSFGRVARLGALAGGVYVGGMWTKDIVLGGGEVLIRTAGQVLNTAAHGLVDSLKSLAHRGGQLGNAIIGRGDLILDENGLPKMDADGKKLRHARFWSIPEKLKGNADQGRAKTLNRANRLRFGAGNAGSYLGHVLGRTLNVVASPLEGFGPAIVGVPGPMDWTKEDGIWKTNDVTKKDKDGKEIKTKERVLKRDRAGILGLSVVLGAGFGKAKDYVQGGSEAKLDKDGKPVKKKGVRAWYKKISDKGAFSPKDWEDLKQFAERNGLQEKIDEYRAAHPDETPAQAMIGIASQFKDLPPAQINWLIHHGFDIAGEELTHVQSVLLKGFINVAWPVVQNKVKSGSEASADDSAPGKAAKAKKAKEAAEPNPYESFGSNILKTSQKEGVAAAAAEFKDEHVKNRDMKKFAEAFPYAAWGDAEYNKLEYRLSIGPDAQGLNAPADAYTKAEQIVMRKYVLEYLGLSESAKPSEVQGRATALRNVIREAYPLAVSLNTLDGTDQFVRSIDRMCTFLVTPGAAEALIDGKYETRAEAALRIGKERKAAREAA
jgi:hypothetical protein